MADSYRRAGVDIDAGAKAVELMRSAVKSTFGARVLADVGYFGGLFALDDDEKSGQVLVASADGVGTKLKLTFLLGTHTLAGQDIVNHCVNDILTCGAKPLFFLDYIASGKVVPEQVAEAVTGMAEACREAGCALLGGETAEMPGMYAPGEYDVAGFVVGMVTRDRLLLGRDIIPGDLIFGLPSNGLHTNGFSLARTALDLNGESEQVRERLLSRVDVLGTTLGDALTRPHRSYLRDMSPLLNSDERPVKGMAHITGGGLVDNIPRMLPEGCAVDLYEGSWNVPPVFGLIQRAGNVSPGEMRRVFNMGLGLVFAAAPEALDLIKGVLPEVKLVGRVVEQGPESTAGVRFVEGQKPK